jgi:hypothetical protein
MKRLALVLALVGCARSERADQTFAGAPSPERARESHQATFMQGQLMVAPVRLPSNENGRMRIFVYLALPEGAKIQGSDLRSLTYPEGTQANRVEMWAPEGATLDAIPDSAWEAMDVRGLRVHEGKVEHYVFRPQAGAPQGAMLGVRWLRDGAGAEQQGTDVLGQLALDGKFRGGRTLLDRTDISRRIKALNDCKSCHQPGREESAGLVHRSMDASGYVQIASVFRNEEPIETYRPRDHNRSDPYARVQCGSGSPSTAREGCDDGTVPRVRYDLKRALTDGQPHAAQVCAARKYLAMHMSDSLRSALASELSLCGVSP